MAKLGHSAKDLPLKLIPFITPSEEIVTTTSKSRASISTELTGKEVSQFYDSVISTPSEICKKQVKYSKKKPLTKHKDSPPPVNLTSDSIFRFAQEGNINQIQQCITAGYSIDQQDRYGWTPLMCATCEGHSEAVEYLLKQGANPNIQCKQGMSPLDIALKRKHKKIIHLFQTGLELNPPTCLTTEQSTEEKYCNSCKIYYNISTVNHERSIAHLFNAKKTEISTFYHIPENNKGFQIMLKSGWDKNKGLGLKAEGRKFPIKTVLKKDRACIGKHKEVAKVTHFDANDKRAVKAGKHLPIKTIREKTLKKWQRKKFDDVTRQREINFRRQFYSDF